MVLTGSLPRLGVGWASLRELPAPATTETLELLDVAEALDGLGRLGGPGRNRRGSATLRRLFERATEPEQHLLRGVLQGGLRQGALEGVMVEAVARAADLPAADVRRATMLAGGLVEVAQAALAEGSAGLASFRLELFRPVQPMLAQTAADVAEALGRVGTAGVEWKLDGARIQVHRDGDEVRAYTRSLADVTDRVPEVVEAVRRLPLDSIVLDGEVIALRPDGRPHPFQVTMSRFGIDARGRDAAERRSPLTPFFFDCLHLDETRPARPPARRAARAPRRARAGRAPPAALRDRRTPPRRSASSRRRSPPATRVSW